MRYLREILLRDGRLCRIESAGPDAAEQTLQHMIQVSGETDFMARYPDEITQPPEQQRAHLGNVEADPGEVYLGAWLPDGTLAAVAWLERISPNERFLHRAELAIAVRRDFWGCGVGAALMEALADAGRQAGYLQLELEVVEENTRARSLYERLGYAVCGRIPRALRYRDGREAAVLRMVKRLDP